MSASRLGVTALQLAKERASEKIDPFVIFPAVGTEQSLGQRVPLVGVPDEQVDISDPAGEFLHSRHSSSFVVGIVCPGKVLA
jgi:hypothetical protein